MGIKEDNPNLIIKSPPTRTANAVHLPHKANASTASMVLPSFLTVILFVAMQPSHLAHGLFRCVTQPKNQANTSIAKMECRGIHKDQNQIITPFVKCCFCYIQFNNIICLRGFLFRKISIALYSFLQSNFY